MEKAVMGLVRLSLSGSFGAFREKEFSAKEHGHAAAIASVIKYLAEVELPEAIRNDHKCHSEGLEPNAGFAGMGKILGKRLGEK